MSPRVGVPFDQVHVTATEKARRKAVRRVPDLAGHLDNAAGFHAWVAQLLEARGRLTALSADRLWPSCSA